MSGGVVVRVRFTKHGKVRFTGHRDVARIWERAVRRAGIPVAWTEGFTPRPRISFGLALPTGDESEGEYLDLTLEATAVGDDGLLAATGASRGERIEIESLPARLSACLPNGIDVVAVATIEPGGPSLQEAVASCSWWFDVRDVEADEADRFVRRILDADELPFVRRRKGREVTVDLRPTVRSLVHLGASPRGRAFAAELAARPFSVRPAELLTAADPALELGIARRTHQWIEGDERREPIPAREATPTDAPVGAR